MNAPDPYFEEAQRQVPHSIESEQSVLGALLLDNNAIDAIGELKAEHFFRFEHRLIFEAITALIVAGKTADAVTVYERLTATGQIEKTGGLPYINRIVQETPGAKNVARYAEIVVERWRLRGILAATDEITAAVHERAGRDATELIAFAQSKFEPLVDARADGPQMLGDLLTPVVQAMDAEYHGGGVQATATGFIDLDFKLGGGMHGGDLIVLAARPAMGKTALSMGFAEHVAAEYDLPVAVFSMEMPAKQLAQRFIASQGNIPLQRVRNGSRMEDADWPKLTSAVGTLADLRIMIDDTPGQTLAAIASRARAIKRKYGLKLIVVDYLQLMTGGPDERHDLKIGSYSAGLKVLAKQLDVPVIVLSQLNRALEQRPNKRPIMADLRDSGAIEQDADTILFLYRDEVYHENSPDAGVAEVIIAKQRNGAPGTAHLAFIGEQARFADLAMGYVPAPRNKSTRQSRGFDD